MTRRLADAQGYRRGMVLGLTMAEVMLLLVFLLLLAASALLFRRDGKAEVLQAEQVREAETAVTITTLRNQVAAGDARTAVLQSTLDTALAESHANAVALERARALTETVLKQGQLLRLQATDLRADLQAMTGQNTQMRNELARVHGNAGSGLPYCWVSPDGRPITAFRVQLRDGGVVAQPPEPRPRPDDPVWTKLAPLQRGVLLPIETFMTQAASFVAQSDAEGCRYAIDVIDATGPSNKLGYKGLMNRLWGSFLLHEVAG